MLLKKWCLNLSLTAGSTRLSLRFAAETLIPSAVDSPLLKPPRSAPFPPPNRPRKKKLLSKIGFLRSLHKIRLFRRGTILPATPSPTDDEDDDGDERRRSPISSSSRNARKAAAVAVSLWAVAVAWILSERLRRWCGRDSGLACPPY